MTSAATRADIEQGARRLLAGGLVAFPTETVYGLGADAQNPAAIAAIYAAKGRPADHPVIVHLAPGADLAYWAKDIPDVAYDLVKAFWPGPLTLILPRANHIPDAVSGGQDTIGLRCPAHPVAQQLLRQFAQIKGGQGGVAAPSANKFGQVSPTTAQHVRNEFPELDAQQLLVLEGGAATVGIESTILDVSRVASGVAPVLLRPGHVSADDIARVIGIKPLMQADANAPRVSGSLKAHYAPRTPLRLADRGRLQHDVANLVGAGQRVAVLGFGGLPPGNLANPKTAAAPCQWYEAPNNPHAYAHDLYARLREMDALGVDHIILERPPENEDWRAVNDRIGRAAAAFTG